MVTLGYSFSSCLLAYGEMHNITHEAIVNTTALQEGTRDYYATIAYTDHQIGRLLNTLDELGTAWQLI